MFCCFSRKKILYRVKQSSRIYLDMIRSRTSFSRLGLGRSPLDCRERCNRLFPDGTSKRRENQITKEDQITRGDQITKGDQTTKGDQITKKDHITKEDQITKGDQVREGQNNT